MEEHVLVGAWREAHGAAKVVGEPLAQVWLKTEVYGEVFHVGGIKVDELKSLRVKRNVLEVEPAEVTSKLFNS